jgi:hypothetical protein
MYAMQGMMNNFGAMGFGNTIANGTGVPPVKRDYSDLFTLYVGDLSSETFDLDLLKYFTNKGYKI